MKTIKDFFYISVEKEFDNELPFKGVDGKSIILDTDFNKLHHVTQVGRIVTTPLAITPRKLKIDNTGAEYYEGYRYDTPLMVGDKVYFHHFVVCPENEVVINNCKTYICHVKDIYCVVRGGKIIMLEDYCFVSPIKEAEENYQKKIGDTILYLKSSPGLINCEGRIEFASQAAIDEGVVPGDKVVIHKDSEYELEVEGVTYYRISVKYILAVLE